jgi:Transposase DDE domain/Transposase DNA-binding
MYLKYMKTNYFTGIYADRLPDARLEKRVEKIMLALLNSGSAVINKCCKSLAEKEGAYRGLDNDSIDHNDLTEGAVQRLRENVKGGHVLGLEDTTELNFTSHMGRIGREDKDIGPITKEKFSAGFFCHPVLVVDPSTQMPLGFSSMILWSRSWDKKNRHEREYKKLDITEKESYRWIASALKTKETLTEADTITIVADRECDIYEMFAAVPDSRTHLLIRANIDRNLSEGIKLNQKLASSSVRSVYEFDAPAGKNRTKHTAKMSLKWEKVKINHPVNKQRKYGNPPFVEMMVIEAKELADSVKEGEDPICWILLTTHKVKSAADALQCIEWYSMRWLIEELFHLLKTKGLCFEEAQLETGAGLKKLLVLALQVAQRIMTLRLSLDSSHKIKANLIFSEEEIKFMKIYMTELEGKTEKQKNPYDKGSMQWAAWGIARMGSWSGYRSSHGPPGHSTMKRGLVDFYSKMDGIGILSRYLDDDYLNKMTLRISGELA